MTMQIKHIYSLAFCIIILTNCALKGIEQPLGRQDSTGTPHLIKQGTATQLVVDGHWIPDRKLNGDAIMLDYHLDRMAAENRLGGVLRLQGNSTDIRRVKLYRF